MSDQQPYEPPVVEEIDTEASPAITAAGGTGATGPTGPTGAGA